MPSVVSAILNTIPISQFNRGLAGKIFDEVKTTGAKVVIKNNVAECVLLSPDEYVRLMDEVNDARLLAVATERMSSFDPNTQWVCPQCNRVNSNYVTTCQCGLPKPHIDMSNSWVCKNCGTVNMGNLHRCTSCGSFKNEETSWTCAKCGARNMGSEATCSSCYAPKEISKSSKTPIGQRDWKCPQCKRINPGYVTTCTCGCPSSMGVKLDSYSGGTAPTVPNSDEWKCPHCGKINANYVGTCGCGQTKP